MTVISWGLLGWLKMVLRGFHAEFYNIPSKFLLIIPIIS